MSLIRDFLKTVQGIHATGIATEHSYRSAFEGLFAKLGVRAINEPRRVKVGAPDFIISQGNIVIGHMEVKDLHIPIRGMKDSNKEQQDRYRAGLPSLIYTNGLDWDFYRDGELIASVTIATLLNKITLQPIHFPTLETLLQNFVAQRPQTITDPRDLAERMAGKAKVIKAVLFNVLKDDTDRETDLYGQYQAFKTNLIHTITLDDFAELYAETIAYGMFAARLHDTHLDTFSRHEALELLPKSNPFLRSLFGYVAGHDLDDRIAWIIDELAQVFLACDVSKLMEGFGKLTGQSDPFLHFYETFLAAYNPAKRKARGVWYTPEPAVNFIVRGVDHVLLHLFGLPDGLADTSKVTIDWETGQTDKKGHRTSQRKDVHRVQILDLATGTGTFPAAVIKRIAPKIRDIAPGLWSGYIEKELIPRLHGFEILMASYAMCHIKLDMTLTELGYQPTAQPPRLSIYLTNSLEEGEPAQQDLFAQWLTREAKGANAIKRDMPIMCVIGNPPYLGEGGISDGWIGTLMDDYKKEPGGVEKLKERNPKWLNDLYVKFMRLASHLIEKNGEGVLGFITNHGYLDNPTFRGMRWHLLTTFDRLWVLDLHGNTKKKEVTPEGLPDKNVFDIQQGVAIIIGAKKKGTRKGELAQVMHADLWGEREIKYAALDRMNLDSDGWQIIVPTAPQYLLIPRDHSQHSAYQKGFGIHEFMPVNSVGIVTARDGLTIDMNKDRLIERVKHFATLPPEEARTVYALGKDVRDWRVDWAQTDARTHLPQIHDRIAPITYRPFDTRWTLYTGNSRGFMCYPRHEVMRNMLRGANLGLIVPKIAKQKSGGFVTTSLCGHKAYEAFDINSLFPLYLYPEEGGIEGMESARQVNFDPELYARLQALATHPVFGPPEELAVFDYIYGVLHCPAYRDTYAEFLKSDFPRIPWPTSPDDFWNVATHGHTLRKLHLMDPAAIGPTPYPFTGDGNNTVEKPRLENGHVWINATQHFANIPSEAWTFYIGGYQPAQKWLKDRKGRTLTFEDVKHYQRILKVLAETNRVMQQIHLK